MTLQVEIIPVTPFQQNCCLLWDADTKEAVLTDVGGNADMLWARVQELGLDLQQIWLTHGHLDHAGGVVDLCQYKAVPVIGPHPDDAFWLDQLPEATAKYGFPVSDVVKPTSAVNAIRKTLSGSTKNCSSNRIIGPSLITRMVSIPAASSVSRLPAELITAAPWRWPTSASSKAVARGMARTKASSIILP